MDNQSFFVMLGLTFIFYLVTYFWLIHAMKRFKAKDIRLPKNKFFSNLLVLSEMNFWNMDYKSVFQLSFYLFLIIISIFVILLLIFVLFGWL